MKKTRGFTLLEMLLVLTIMSSVLLLITNYGSARMTQYRRDRTAAQMQQILNAALNYYVTNGSWPLLSTQSCGTAATPAAANTYPLDASSTLIANNYLPATMANSPFAGTAYQFTCQIPAVGGYFQVIATVPTLADAEVLAGEVPVGSYNAVTSGGFTVSAQVQIPGQNLNNARSVNFGAIYHHGACVPVPVCPSGMTAQILATPASVAGVNDAPTTDQWGTSACTTANNCNYINLYPISDFGAYATGPTNVGTTTGSTAGPASCDGSAAAAPCYSDVNSAGKWTPIIDGNQYWRVCLRIITEKGAVTPTASSNSYTAAANYGTGYTNYVYWIGAMGSIAVTTRCTPTGGEPSGSDFTVTGY